MCLELNRGFDFLERITQYYWDRIDSFENKRGMGNLIYLCRKFDLKVEADNLEKQLSGLDAIELGNLRKVVQEEWI